MISSATIQAKQVFVSYLKEHKQRKTTERFAILDEIYSSEDHFDIDSLFERLRLRKKNISKATIYNTIELLLACKLIIRHQFRQNTGVYEKSLEYLQHDHLVCTVCNKVIEFCDPRIQLIKSSAGKKIRFEVLNHSFNLYGICKACNEKLKKQKDKNGVSV